VLSRVADSIFWMSRYIERAENVARFVDVNLNLTLDLGAESGEQWAPLVYTTGDHVNFEERFGRPTQQNVIQFLSFDEQNPNSILSCLSSARENARTVREMISSAMWEELNKFYLMVRSQAAGRLAVDAPYDFFNQIKLSSHLLEGITDATMSHGEPWHFARMGRLVERADKTSRILDVKYFVLLPNVAEVGTPLDTIQWSALLESASALEMYRKRYGRITPTNVAEFLMLDREFPRAMHFCLLKAEESLLAITGSLHGTFRTPAEQQIGRLRSELDYAHIDEIIRDGLHEFIDGFQTQLNQVGEAISETFFSLHPVPPVRDTRGRARSNGTQTQTQSQS
jgi:uncharacterized alpha-E superfamily protein